MNPFHLNSHPSTGSLKLVMEDKSVGALSFACPPTEFKQELQEFLDRMGEFRAN